MSDPTLAEVLTWFKTDMTPKRTTSAGFSGNRLWKSPPSWFRGNTEDPNGLCGDVAFYLHEKMFEKFNTYSTSDGYQIGMILWEGAILNHIANVMFVKGKTSKCKYTYSHKTKLITAINGKSQYTDPELKKLKVLDLYYKKSSDVRTWWADQDSMGGTLTLANLSQIND